MCSERGLDVPCAEDIGGGYCADSGVCNIDGCCPFHAPVYCMTAAVPREAGYCCSPGELANNSPLRSLFGQRYSYTRYVLPRQAYTLGIQGLAHRLARYYRRTLDAGLTF